MKRFLLTGLLFISLAGNTQILNRDSLQWIYDNASHDSTRFIASRRMYSIHEEMNRDSALYFGYRALRLAEKNKKKLAEGYALVTVGYQLTHKGKYGEALPYFLEAFRIAQDPSNASREWQLDYQGPEQNRLTLLAYTHHMLAVLMARAQNVEQEVFHFMEARRIARQAENNIRVMLADMNLGSSYIKLHKLDSALYFEEEALQLVNQTGYKKYLSGIYFFIGKIFDARGQPANAREYYYSAIAPAYEHQNFVIVGRVYNELAKHFLGLGHLDSALYYAHRNREVLQTIGSVQIENNLGIAYENLFRVFQSKGNLDSAINYAAMSIVVRDSIYRQRMTSLSELQQLSFSEQLRLEKQESDREKSRGRMRTYALVGGMILVLGVALFLYRNNLQKNRANKQLASALDDLRATQAQLIQSEKMASLGELTAGIAHEIQNPLNFVNNFSEVNRELIDEMEEELKQGNQSTARLLAQNIRENQEKITHHGKRADSIVKGMLQHSRSSSGQKELTDINDLADEYLRLAYHGLRAREKSFNASFKTDFDPSLQKVNVTAQDVGRVLLNLINNAFYAVSERKKHEDNGYDPIVTVKTRKLKDRSEISVQDNGTGIPKEALDKIFQPFFTTKPTGQGTGLGLSLSYDIVKAHGGELKVESKVGQGTTFIIELPDSRQV